jgi:uncharacterized protein (DUF2141 family)
MKRLIYITLVIIISELLTNSCANPKIPTGGPKDTIPPVLTSSIPPVQSINFKSTVITLKFDENINADKIRQNLIITPYIDLKYKSFIKKSSITLTLDQTLPDSTTYTFNFFDGITDITEKNPAENLILAFSTGPFIDSLYIKGRTYNINDNTSLAKILVGLYKASDTLDITKDKPTYFVTTDEEGEFSLTNIKSASYRLYAFQDENKNLLFDPAMEKHGFLSETIELNKSIETPIAIPLIEKNATPLKLISARPSTHFFEVKYSKPLIAYAILNDTIEIISSTLIDNNESLRIYSNRTYSDSTQLIISATDTLLNTTIDTVYANFRETSKKQAEFTIKLDPSKGTSVFSDDNYHITFSKPIINTPNKDFLKVVLDTLIQLPIKPLSQTTNYSKTELTFNVNITQTQLADSVKAYLDSHPIDSLNMDSIQLMINNRISRINPSTFFFTIHSSAFISADLDSSQYLLQQYKFANIEDYGTITISLSDTTNSFIIQLMNKEKVASQLSNCKNCIFTRIKPGEYWVRILIDANQDGKWDSGNILENVIPEPIRYFPETTTLRSNWEVTLEYSMSIEEE